VATKRSPILGYNHNFRHRGRVFHVQTEDSGVANPHVFTHLFHGGVILTTRKLDYDSAASEETVKSLMQAQHKAVLRDLKKGTFDAKIVEYLGPHPESDEPGADAVVEAPVTEESDATIPVPVVPEPAAPPRAARAQNVEVTVEFASSQPSAPVEIHQPVPDDAPGHVHSPAPPGAPAPPGSMYIQRGGSVRREAPLANTGEMRAVLGDDDFEETERSKSTRRLSVTPAGQARSRPTHPPPIPSTAPRRPTRPPAKPMSRPPAVPSGDSSARIRATQPRASTEPRSSRGAAVVVSRPSVIVGAPPKVVGGSSNAPSRGRRAAPSSAPPPQSKPRPRARAAREEAPPDSLFGGDLISEKSLDEVILAYLSEDPNEE